MPSVDNNNSNFLSQIRERSTQTLAQLDKIRPNADKSISPELDAIRRFSLQIIEKTEDITYKQSMKLAGSSSAGCIFLLTVLAGVLLRQT